MNELEWAEKKAKEIAQQLNATKWKRIGYGKASAMYEFETPKGKIRKVIWFPREDQVQAKPQKKEEQQERRPKQEEQAKPQTKTKSKPRIALPPPLEASVRIVKERTKELEREKQELEKQRKEIEKNPSKEKVEEYNKRVEEYNKKVEQVKKQAEYYKKQFNIMDLNKDTKISVEDLELALKQKNEALARKIAFELGVNLEQYKKQMELKKLDLNKDNKLDLSDVDIAIRHGDYERAQQILNELNAGMSVEEYQRTKTRQNIIRAYDRDKSGKLEFEELKALYKDHPELAKEVIGERYFHEFEKALKFEEFDINKDKKVDIVDVDKAFEQGNFKLAYQILDELGIKVEDYVRYKKISKFDVDK
ncbi:hypothetical protein DRP04_09575, partial [Archaeoglobales archaeon]